MMKAFVHLCRFMGIKVVWEVHNILPHEATEKDRAKSRWLYENADALIFHSEGDVERSREVLGSRVVKKDYTVIPHGNFNDSYPNEVSREEARKALGIPGDKEVILCFGFIRRNRGYEYLLEAARDMEDTIILVAGGARDKEVEEWLRAKDGEIKNLDLRIGFIPDAEIQNYFNASDFVALPYTDITTSGVVPLSYAFHRPVISSAIPGITEVVEEGKTGLLIPPGNSAALREAIEKMRGMDLVEMGRYARDYAEEKFSWNSNANKIKDLYDSLLTRELRRKEWIPR